MTCLASNLTPKTTYKEPCTATYWSRASLPERPAPARRARGDALRRTCHGAGPVRPFGRVGIARDARGRGSVRSLCYLGSKRRKMVHFEPWAPQDKRECENIGFNSLLPPRFPLPQTRRRRCEAPCRCSATKDFFDAKKVCLGRECPSLGVEVLFPAIESNCRKLRGITIVKYNVCQRTWSGHFHLKVPEPDAVTPRFP